MHKDHHVMLCQSCHILYNKRCDIKEILIAFYVDNFNFIVISFFLYKVDIFEICQVRVQVTKEFLECVHKGVLFKRPSWRVDNARVNTLHDSALLMSDHSIFPHGINAFF